MKASIALAEEFRMGQNKRPHTQVCAHLCCDVAVAIPSTYGGTASDRVCSALVTDLV